MRVQTATMEDVPNWLILASEVEHLFGPMVDNRLFHEELIKNIHRGSAICVRKRDGGAGRPLLGGLLFSSNHPVYRIGWLAVAKEWRRRGVGRALVQHVFDLVVPPAQLLVTTFDEKDPFGIEAVKFYRQLDFRPTRITSVRAPSGLECRVYSKVFQ